MEALSLSESLKFVEKYGIPVAKYFVAKSLEDAKKLGEELGYPLVIKIDSKFLLHKSEKGGVKVGVEKAELEKAWEELNKIGKELGEYNLILQEMKKGLEVFVGGKKDPQFNQIIAFGLGGIFVEVFEDVAFRAVPISEKDAEEMIKEIKGYKILKGYRGKVYELNSLKEILLKVSNLLEENPNLKELDLNPIFVNEKGAWVVDARIIFD